MSLPPTKCPVINPLLGIKAEAVTVLVDHGVEIEGTIRNKSMRAILIAGSVKGLVESNGPVIITASGSITGSLKATSVQLAGALNRQDEADRAEILGPLVLEKTSHLGCDAFAAGYEVQYGATIDGAMRPRKASTEEESAVTDAIEANSLKPLRAGEQPQPAQTIKPTDTVVRPAQFQGEQSSSQTQKPGLTAAFEQYGQRLGSAPSGT